MKKSEGPVVRLADLRKEWKETLFSFDAKYSDCLEVEGGYICNCDITFGFKSQQFKGSLCKSKKEAKQSAAQVAIEELLKVRQEGKICPLNQTDGRFQREFSELQRFLRARNEKAAKFENDVFTVELRDGSLFEESGDGACERLLVALEEREVKNQIRLNLSGFESVWVLIDLENCRSHLMETLSQFQASESVHWIGFVSKKNEVTVLGDLLKKRLNEVVIAPSSLTDSADIAMVMWIGKRISSWWNALIFVVTEDNFGQTLVEQINGGFDGIPVSVNAHICKSAKELGTMLQSKLKRI